MRSLAFLHPKAPLRLNPPLDVTKGNEIPARRKKRQSRAICARTEANSPCGWRPTTESRPSRETQVGASLVGQAAAPVRARGVRAIDR